jgi:hypothetical protein
VNVFRIIRGIASVGLLCLMAVACAGPGQGIADRIRAANSPIVREVSLSPVSFWQGNTTDLIIVYLIDEASDAQALDFWCDVVIPAGAEQLPPGKVDLRKGGERSTGGSRTGSEKVLDNPTCP